MNWFTSQVNRHATDTRIGLMDSTVPVEAMLGIGMG